MEKVEVQRAADSVQPLKPDVLLLQHFQAFHLRRHQPSVFATPSLVGLDRYAGLPANLLDRCSILGLLRMVANLSLDKEMLQDVMRRKM
ncbi:hypothetical protein FHT00_003465 [Sphingomonas insulae]|nr:hypothetical protein [Sphingomonas insulae]